MINPFLQAALNVISMMAMLNPEPGKPFLKKDRKAIGDISGVIGLTGEMKGVVVVSFSTGAACKIVGAMLGEEFTELNADISDAVGELTNMISGDARRQLAQMGHNFEAGLPTIISGSGHEIEAITQGPVIAIPYKVEGHDFVVEASFES